MRVTACTHSLPRTHTCSSVRVRRAPGRCDVRLLRFIKDLVYLNQEVSMLFRGSTPQHMRQPKSKQLASILHIDDFEEDQLRKGLRPPPGLYEWTTAERFAQLVRPTPRNAPRNAPRNSVPRNAPHKSSDGSLARRVSLRSPSATSTS